MRNKTIATITLVERIILESLSKKNKNIQDLAKDTAIDVENCREIIQELLVKNIIIIQDGAYGLNPYTHPETKNEILSNDIVFAETNMIVKETIRKSMQDKQSFKMKKVALTDKNLKLLNAMLINIEIFLNENEEKNKANHESNIIFWGVNNYESICKKIASHY